MVRRAVNHKTTASALYQDCDKTAVSASLSLPLPSHPTPARLICLKKKKEMCNLNVSFSTEQLILKRWWGGGVGAMGNFFFARVPAQTEQQTDGQYKQYNISIFCSLVTRDVNQ